MKNSMRFAPMQHSLEQIYHLEHHVVVDDFIETTDALLSPVNDRPETVLVRVSDAHETGEHSTVEIRVVLHTRVEQTLAGEQSTGLSRFTAWCMALEGVSHFVKLVFRALEQQPVTELELEFQAEVDKFVVALLSRVARASPTMATRTSSQIREALFERVQFLDSADTERGHRYRQANRLAAQYARSIERRFVREGRLDRLIDELRSFYRAPADEKVRLARAA